MRWGMEVARFWRLLGLGVVALGLAGCDARHDLWYRNSDDVRAFMTAMSCTANGAGIYAVTGQKLYQVVGWRWWLNDPCRGAVCNPLTANESPDRYAFGLTFINDAGASVLQKFWVVDRKDMLALSVGMSSKFTMPNWLHAPPPGRTGETCVGLVTLPWQRSGNRPYWVADQTLRLNATDLQTASLRTALVLVGLGLVFVVGTAFAAAGYFDAPRQRGGGIVRAVIFGIVALGVLLFIQSYVTEPAERLPQIQSYYSFYDKLPKNSGNLLPLRPDDARVLFAGPPLTTDLDQRTDMFQWAALIALIGFLLLSAKRIIMGLYWVFVPLPLEVRFRRARARGDWPRASEIVDAVRQGTMNKSTWQSRAMELKAERFRRELDAMAAQLRTRARQ
jgi:hypothetical protein